MAKSRRSTPGNRQAAIRRLGITSRAFGVIMVGLAKVKRKRKKKNTVALDAFKKKMKKIEDLVHDLNQSFQELQDAFVNLSDTIKLEDPKGSPDTGRP